MKNEFSTWYLALLRKQVEEEIEFLKANRHDTAFITTPCMFCVPAHNGAYHHCRRLKDLAEFQSKIMHHIGNQANHRRRIPIGCESPMQNQCKYESVLSHHELPLLSSQF